MTPQEFFEKSVTGVIQQGKRSGRFTGFLLGRPMYSCYYRHEGLKCAVGHCISDEEYNPDWDSKGYDGDSLGAGHVARELGWSRDITVLACDLQNAHDTIPNKNFIQKFAAMAEEIGVAHGLDTSFIKGIMQ